MKRLKRDLRNFAALGGEPLFPRPLPVGQLYFPSWERYERAMRGIFEREYYTNHGPLIAELEQRLAAFLGVRHAVCVTNASIGLMISVLALELKGKVIVPAFASIATAQSLSWAGLEPVFCGVDPDRGCMTPQLVEPLIDRGVSGILAVNPWGGCSDAPALERLAQRHGLRLYFDSAHAFGCRSDGRMLGGFGSLEVFSFHASDILSAADGGCISTNDDLIAARLRSMRSSYGIGTPAPVPVTCNGRFSEAQAALALLSFEDFPANRERNKALFQAYRAGVGAIPGLTVVEPRGVELSNHEHLACRVDESRFGLSRDDLARLLQAENVQAARPFYPGSHRLAPYDALFPKHESALPNTDALAGSLMQLPLGAMVDEADVRAICSLLGAAHEHAAELRTSFAG